MNLRPAIIIAGAVVFASGCGYLLGAHWGGYLGATFYWLGLASYVAIQAAVIALDRLTLNREIRRIDSMIAFETALRREYVAQMQKRFGDDAVPPLMRLQ